MPRLRDFLPAPPPNLPIPRFLLEKQESSAVEVEHQGCEAGIDCIKDHMARAHLYIGEAIRFSSNGDITPAARKKIRQMRAELLCEDDFAAAMETPPAIRAEVLKLLASCRSTWKAMDRCGIDTASGTIDDLRDLSSAIEALWDEAYRIDEQYRLSKEEKPNETESVGEG